MMAVLLLSFGIILLAVLGLALGILAGRAPIAGSCGGREGCRNCGSCPRRAASPEETG